jgi:[acyl-carrier-protein] S-malonyltransferase
LCAWFGWPAALVNRAAQACGIAALPITALVMSIAFIFPGQGSQAVGMGQSLAAAFASARHVFEEVDDALGEKLSRLMREGPEADLTLTANAQPALMAVSLAAMRALEAEFGVGPARASAYAGHSLGEYSALAAAGAFAIPDAARLLRRRGEAMQAAVPVGEGAMASLIGKVDVALAEEIAAEGAKAGVCVVANDNNVGNVVISGSKAGVDAAIAAAKAKGARAIPLNVSAPFHSPLMEPAAREMEIALKAVTIAPPVAPLFANVTTKPTQNPVEIRSLLIEQVCGRVRWRESVEAMVAAGITRFVEIGAGKTLAGMVKRIAPDAEALSLNEPADLEAFAKTI